MPNDFPATPSLDRLSALIPELLCVCGYRRGAGWAKHLLNYCTIVNECENGKEPSIRCKPMTVFNPEAESFRPKSLVSRKAPGFKVRIRPDEWWRLYQMTNGYVFWRDKKLVFAGLAGFDQPNRPTRDDDHLTVIVGRQKKGYYVESVPCVIEREMPGKWVVCKWLSGTGKSNVSWFNQDRK